MQLRNLVAQTAPGTTIRFKVFRDGAERELAATLGELDVRTASSRGRGGSPGAPGSALAGVQVENLTAETARRLNLPVTARGVVITDIDSDSPAADAGLQRGDLIVEVNRQPVTSVSEFNAALQRAGKKSVLLRVRRADGARFVVVEPRE